ncbi:LysR family transcriptional regulator [Bordetella pertussis]|nr:LysR family transcriptional regulator [Bordetella pertussis]
MGVSIVPACLARAGLAGTCYVAFEHQARSVCQIAWPSLAPTSLQATALQAALRHFAPPPVRA